MRTSQQPACILHVRAWRETSLLLECLTQDFGRIGLVARGARNARGRVSRAALEPFQSLRIDFSGQGELASLGAVEMSATPRDLKGVAALSGLYINELLVRLIPRGDPYPGLLARYEQLLDQLAAGVEAAWPLRRFERDLLAAAGYALQLMFDADSGEAIEPDAEYVFLTGQGPQPWHGQAGLRLRGQVLLDFAADRYPEPAAMPLLRRLLRQEIQAQLGGRELESWRVLGAALRAAAT